MVTGPYAAVAPVEGREGLESMSETEERHRRKKSKKEKKSKTKKSKKDRIKIATSTGEDGTPEKAKKLKLKLTLTRPAASSGSEADLASPRTSQSLDPNRGGKRRKFEDEGADRTLLHAESPQPAPDDHGGMDYDNDEYDFEYGPEPNSPVTDPANMTKRQRMAFLARSGKTELDEGGSVEDYSSPNMLSEERVDAGVSLERIAQKQEHARKRRLLLDRQQEEIKKQTIDKLLNKQTSSRLRKEEEDAEKIVARCSKEKQIMGPFIRYTSNKEGEFVTFPPGCKVLS